MILTIWRHGEAERARIDRGRELTEAGRNDIRVGCRRFKAACGIRDIPDPEMILYSPWVRTAQTGEIIAATFAQTQATAESALRPDSEVAAVGNALSGLVTANSTTEHILIVSHQPLVSYLADYYIGTRGVIPSLAPGGMVTLSMDILEPACGTLLFWAMPPEYEIGV